jgi:neutral/alkaline ceramidase-like enzyme
MYIRLIAAASGGHRHAIGAPEQTYGETRVNYRIAHRPFRLVSSGIALALVAMTAVLLAAPFALSGELRAGAARTDITPPAGTPSAGYGDRMGRGMKGVHDPLLAAALVLDNGEKMIAFVGVDHLGFGEAMVRAVKEAVHAKAETAECEIYLGSSHTHAGGGAHLDIPVLGMLLAGKFDPDTYQSYIDGAVDAVLRAAEKLAPAKLGVGYGHAPGLNAYRGDWPPNVETCDDVAVIKVTGADGAPMAVLFNFAAHPTVLSGKNMLFSADFIGGARRHVIDMIGAEVQPVFFNGAQGDVSPRAPEAEDGFERCDLMGKALADEVKRVWDATETSGSLKIETKHYAYEMLPHRTTGGFSWPGSDKRTSELNAIVLNDRDAFVTIPGELSCIYDADIKRFGGWLGFNQVSILGLTNDAHGYIVTPESWRHKTYESTLSFGGELYGERMKSQVYALLHYLEPEGAYNADKLIESSVLSN